MQPRTQVQHTVLFNYH